MDRPEILENSPILKSNTVPLNSLVGYCSKNTVSPKGRVKKFLGILFQQKQLDISGIRVVGINMSVFGFNFIEKVFKGLPGPVSDFIILKPGIYGEPSDKRIFHVHRDFAYLIRPEVRVFRQELLKKGPKLFQCDGFEYVSRNIEMMPSPKC